MARPIYFDGLDLTLGFDYPIFKEKFDKTSGVESTMSLAIAKITEFHSVNIDAVITADGMLESSWQKEVLDMSDRYDEIEDEIPF